MEKWKLVNRYFVGIFYKDDIKYKEYIKNILDNFTEVTWIEHDRDVNDDGQTKKTHTHILFKVRRKRKTQKRNN